MSLATRECVPTISVECSVKDSTCRSCNRTILAERTRLKIAYPKVTVQYAERTGSPSFFMHLECFRDRPVDYVKDGANAWKSWRSIARFAYDMSQVGGLMRHPDAKIFFGTSIASSPNMGTTPTPSLKLDSAITMNSSTSAKPEAGSGAGTLIPPANVGDKRAREPPSTDAVPTKTHQCNTAPNLARSEASSSAKRPRVLVQFKLQPFEEILEECQGDREEANRQYRMHLDLAAQREAAYAQQIQVVHGGGAIFGAKELASKRVAQGSTEKRSNKSSSADLESSSESESDSESSSGDATEESESEHEDSNDGLLQWLKPGQLSRQVGISISVLRRWANTGVVQTLVSEGGHRLFNMASVTEYIAQQAAKATKAAAE